MVIIHYTLIQHYLKKFCMYSLNIQKVKFTFSKTSDINFKREFKKLEILQKTPNFKPMASKRKVENVYYVTPRLIREIEELKREGNDFSKFKFELLTCLNFPEVVEKFRLLV